MYLQGLTKTFNSLKVFNDFSMEIYEGEITTILGPSGCGKTTLLRILSGLDHADTDFENPFYGKSISYIFQEDRLLPWKTALENISLVLESNYSKEESKKIANRFLDIVKLKNFKNYYPNQLSGGMKQRVSIARAFAVKSDVLLMDEPFKGLDHSLKHELIRIFLELWKEDKRTVLFITHCKDEAKSVSHRIITLGANPVKILNKKIRRCECLV